MAPGQGVEPCLAALETATPHGVPDLTYVD